MKFSIITCTYNSAKYLKTNIKSVATQRYSDYEHILIDGFSTDATVEIIEAYQKNSPGKVQFFQLEKKGISNAMNVGIQKATGDFLIHLHSDDSFFTENVLQNIADFLEKNPDLDWIYGLANIINENDEPIGIFPKRKIFQHSSASRFGKYFLKFFNYIPHQTVFIRKAIFEKFGDFDETLSSGMDPDLWLRIRKKTKWCFFDKIICNYRIHPEAQSSSKKREIENQKNLEQVQKRYLNFMELFLAKILNFCIKRLNRTMR